MRRIIAIAAACLLGMAGSTAHAATITFDNIVATWSNATPTGLAGYSGSGTNSAHANWGNPAIVGGSQSGYDFNAFAPLPINVITPPSPSADFVLGTFTHRNQPIDAGTSITGIRLSVSTSVAVNAVNIGVKTFVFDFTHNETPNGDNPCADGGAYGVGVNLNGCADQVTFHYNTLSDTFNLGGVDYTVTLRGFEQAGVPVSTFWTKEQATNDAKLVAFVTTRADAETRDVPEPSSLVLLGASLIGLASRARRR